MTAFERIRDAHVPLFLQRFEKAAADYNSEGEAFEPHTVLGIRGQFADIWRKVWKLKKALWDGATLAGEQPIEIIDDLLAHLFLTRDMLVETVPEPGALRPVRTIKDITGHDYDGCPVCVRARFANPGLVI